MGSIEKLLLKESGNTDLEREELVIEAKLLMSSQEQAERDLLRKIGLDNDIRFLETKRGEQLQKEEARKAFKKDVVTLAEITAVCRKFRLKMRQAKFFLGKIPPETGAEILRFVKENNIKVAESSEYTNFYVVGNPAAFKDATSLKEILLNSAKEASQEIARIKAIRALDPVVLYKLKERDDFIIVKAWGQDFSWYRRFVAIITTKRFLTGVNFLSKLVLVFLWGWLAVKFVPTEDTEWYIFVYIVGLLATSISVSFYLWEKKLIEFRRRVIHSISSIRHIRLHGNDQDH